MNIGATTQNPHILAWVKDIAALTQPDSIVWVEGGDAEYHELCALLVQQDVFTRLNPAEYPDSFWCRSDPSDVARVEERTFICSRSKDDAGPTNNWRDPAAMRKELNQILASSMKGRTLYVVPYLMGSVGSPYAKVGFELTDSPYVVVNMMIMARVGRPAIEALGNTSDHFVRGVHTVGTLNAQKRYVAHFPESEEIISVNSNYGGNALQGKKCFALRIASSIARREGWLAEHMFIVGITTPQGKKHYVAGAFPSACGKTNLAMLVPPELYQKKGWKLETVGDDIAWINVGPDGRLYAVNPEAGFFGVAPGTSYQTNPNAMETIKRGHTIFTNTAYDPVRNVPWWEGMEAPPEKLINWLGNEWYPGSATKAAHPNSRFTVPARQCPSIDPAWESPLGVPLSAIIFGGRRSNTAPLVYETLNWAHGTYTGVTMASQTTAAAAGQVGVLRRDPMAMLPFIGYHVGDYIAHWLSFGQRTEVQLPKIFHVNWFRTNAAGKYLWPGFGDNMRVLEWMVGRVEGTASGSETPIGTVPKPSELNLEGLSIPSTDLEELLSVRKEEWHVELESQETFFKGIGSKLPQEMLTQNSQIKRRFEKN